MKPRINQQKVYSTCDKCGKKFLTLGKVSIKSSNPWQRYQGSQRPIQSNSNMHLCKTHFKQFNKELNNLIYNF